MTKSGNRGDLIESVEPLHPSRFEPADLVDTAEAALEPSTSSATDGRTGDVRTGRSQQEERPVSAGKSSSAFVEARRGLGRARRIALVLGVVSGALWCAPAIFVYDMIERALPAEDLKGIVWSTVFIAAAIAFAAIFDVARGQVLSRAGAWFERVLAEPVLSRVFETRLATHARSDALADLAIVSATQNGGVARALSSAPGALMALAALVWLAPLLAALVLALNLSVLVYLVVQRRLLDDPGKRLERFMAATTARLSGLMRQAETVRALGLAPALAAKARDPGERAIAAARDLGDRIAWFRGFAVLFFGVFTAAALGLGIWLVMRGEIGAGGFAAAVVLGVVAARPSVEAVAGWPDWLCAQRASARLETVFSRPDVDRSQMRTSPAAIASGAAALEVDNLSYQPSGGGARLIDGVSLSVNSGEVLGLVGPSGAGKTTLCRLLVGVAQPSGGVVRLDGSPLSEWDPDVLGAQIGYVPQHVALFDGRINENIARMTDGGSVQMLEAARSAGIHEAIRALPDGYDFFVGDDGRRLSGGHRQRVGLARALFGGPPVIVLDEPNAHLDQVADKALAAMLDELKERGAAVVLASHSPSLMARADRLLVLRDGKMVISGEREFILRELYGGASLGPPPERLAGE